MSSRPVISGTFKIEELSDEHLYSLLENIELQVADKEIMEKYSLHAESVRMRQGNLIKEIHRRKLNLCLSEICALYEFRVTKKNWVIKWLNRINIKDIKPLVPEDV